MRYFLILTVLIVLVGCASRESGSSGSLSATSPTSSEASKTTLNRSLVLDLLKKRFAPKQVLAHMNTSSRVTSDLTPIYKQMIDDKLITCQWSESCLCWSKCRPNEQQYDLRLESEEQGHVVGTMYMKMGWKEVREVTGISSIDASTSVAEYLVSYVPNEDNKIIKKYPGAFWMDNTNSESHKAYLRKYDDGWRIERLQ